MDYSDFLKINEIFDGLAVRDVLSYSAQEDLFIGISCLNSEALRALLDTVRALNEPDDPSYGMHAVDPDDGPPAAMHAVLHPDETLVERYRRQKRKEAEASPAPPPSVEDGEIPF